MLSSPTNTMTMTLTMAKTSNNISKKSNKKKSGNNNKNNNVSCGTKAVPLFLRKTYAMVDNCDPNIATWDYDGKSFVIKDDDKFAAEVIPQYFKHNNLSSFVRQLNFYGFRKIKKEQLKINSVSEALEAKYCRFRHDNFQKNKPHLLSDIRKANASAQDVSVSDLNATNLQQKNEINTLKKRVNELESIVTNMSNDVNKLASLVTHVMMMTKTTTTSERSPTAELPMKSPYGFTPISTTKKRKLNSEHFSSLDQHQQQQQHEEQRLSTGVVVPMSVTSCPSTMIEPEQVMSSSSSSRVIKVEPADVNATDSDLILETNTDTTTHQNNNNDLVGMGVDDEFDHDILADLYELDCGNGGILSNNNDLQLLGAEITSSTPSALTAATTTSTAAAIPDVTASSTGTPRTLPPSFEIQPSSTSLATAAAAAAAVGAANVHTTGTEKTAPSSRTTTTVLQPVAASVKELHGTAAFTS